ncbi:MAG: RNA-processing protein [Methanoregulaceae archaeon]|nr:RNA-processing protein [Methanoregulaceae archaeon]
MRSYWFGDFDGTCCQPAPDDLAVLVKRVRYLIETREALLPEWEMAVRCGFVNNRACYLERLRRTAISYSREMLDAAMSADTSGLIPMVRMADQIDEAINLLTERATEWYTAMHPGFHLKSTQMRGAALIDSFRKDTGGPLLSVLDEIDKLTDQRRILTREIAGCAEQVLPNSSALVGGLVAARLAAEAGSIRELAMMPASSLQVLGSRKALFAHLATGSPPPKHGVVFQHGRVHGSRKEKRGRVARVLSGKLGIAARIDYYRKELDPAFIRNATDAIRKAGSAP